MRDGIENLSPSYFSLVMATSIVSIAGGLLGMIWLARCFFVVSLIAFVLLWALTALRVVFFPHRLLEDLRKHAVSPGYFTMVAGTAILGRQCVGGGVVDHPVLAGCLWIFALSLWLLITYAVFTAIIVCPHKPSVERGLNGVWLIAAVATQSISVLGTKIAVSFPLHGEMIMLVSLMFYLMGCMLYFNIIALIFYRMTFVDFPEDMTPPYWINMGATAIATQAGTTLVLDSGSSALVASLVPYLKGFTLFFWAAGTWWVPLLIALGVWTHVVKRVPLTYTPQVWGLVFPFGMYTASTDQLARVLGLDFLLIVPQVTIYFALLAWALAFVGLLRHLGKGLVFVPVR